MAGTQGGGVTHAGGSSEAAVRSIRGEEGLEVVCQSLGLVDGDEGSAVVDPHQVGVLEVFGESFGAGGGHELVVSCPDDEDRAGEGALLVGPLEQLLRFGDVAEVLVEVAADLAVVAQRMDPAPEQFVGNPPLGQGAEGEGGSLQTSVTSCRSNSVRNSAIMVASAGRDRSASSGIGVVCAPNGSSGTMQR